MSVELPVEIWSNIILLSRPTFNKLIQLSTVSHQFRRIILDKWFLKKYFSFYPIFKQNLIIYNNFTDRITNHLTNSIPLEDRGTLSLYDPSFTLHTGVEIVSNPLFNYILTFDRNSSRVGNMYDFASIVRGTVSISFWFLLKGTTGRRPCVNRRQHCFTLDFREGLYDSSAPYSSLNMNITLNIDSGRQMKFKVKKSYREDWALSSGSGETILETDQWHHLALVLRVNKGTLTIYLDGKKYTDFEPTQQFAIPFRYVSTGFYFEEGSIADIGFWRRELWPIEVNAIYRQKTTLDKIDLLEEMLTNMGIN